LLKFYSVITIECYNSKLYTCIIILYTGYLDRPVFDRKIKEFSYKVILSGKSGSGKTSTVAKLAGHEVQRLYRETPGKVAAYVY